MSDIAKDFIEKAKSKPVGGASIGLLIAAGLSVFTSLALQFSKENDEALFVGQWAPTLVGAAIFAYMMEAE